MTRWCAASVAMALVVLVGCSDSGPRVVPVSGVLTDGGNPVVDASLTFYPASGGRPSEGLTDAEGRFELEYAEGKKGAVVGEHTVSVLIGGGTPPAPPPGASMRGAARKVAAPRTVKLDKPATIVDGDNDLQLELKAS